MATNPLVEEARRQNPNSFGDAAAASLDNRVAQIPTNGAPKAPAADGSQSNPLNTDLGRNLTNAAAALPGAAAVPGAAGMAGGLVARAFGASQPAVSALGQAAQAAAPYAPVVAGGAALAAGSNNAGAPPAAPAVAPPQQPQSLVAAAGIPLPPSAPAPSPAAAPAAPASSNVTRVGNSYSGGPNISGDITVNGAAPGGGSGAPRSLVEAAGIVPGSAGRSNSGGVMSNPLVAAALGGESPGVNAPVVRHSGNDWQSRNDLRNAQVLAGSIMNDGGRWDQHKGMSPEAAYAAALGNADMAARAGQSGADVAAMRENAGLMREGMQQGGANQRSLWQYALEQQKVNQAGEAQGYANRTNALVEAARKQVAAEPDQTKRRSLVEYMRDVEGRAQPADPYLVVPGGQHVDPTSGKAYNTPSSVFNRQSGQFVQQPQGQGALQAPAVGAVQQGYRFKGGDPASPSSWERAT